MNNILSLDDRGSHSPQYSVGPSLKKKLGNFMRLYERNQFTSQLTAVFARLLSAALTGTYAATVAGILRGPRPLRAKGATKGRNLYLKSCTTRPHLACTPSGVEKCVSDTVLPLATQRDVSVCHGMSSC